MPLDKPKPKKTLRQLAGPMVTAEETARFAQRTTPNLRDLSGAQVTQDEVKRFGKLKFQHSPDRYDPTSLAETPPRAEYHKSPENLNTNTTAKRAGGIPEKVEGGDGTDNKRANYKTKSSDVPSPAKGTTRWGGVNSYDDTGELP
jgi:hypothetical protein